MLAKANGLVLNFLTLFFRYVLKRVVFVNCCKRDREVSLAEHGRQFLDENAVSFDFASCLRILFVDHASAVSGAGPSDAAARAAVDADDLFNAVSIGEVFGNLIDVRL